MKLTPQSEMTLAILCGFAFIVTAACAPHKPSVTLAELPPDIVSNAMAFVVSNPTNRLSEAACLASSFERFIKITTNRIISEELVITLLGKPAFRDMVLPHSIEYATFRLRPGPESPGQLLVFAFHGTSLAKVGTCVTEP